MNLKSQIERENKEIFFNLNDFAVERRIGDKKAFVVEDGDQLLKYKQLGIYEATLLIYIESNFFEKTPHPGDALMYQNKKYFIEDVREDMGILEIALKNTR